MKVQVTLVKSPVSSKVFEDTPSIRGMIFKVSHLVSVVEISD